MDRKAILKQIKELIKFSGEQKFKDAKLIDNETIVQVEGETFEVGNQLNLVTPEGLVPAPAGEHTTTEGEKITVDEAGIITNVEVVEVSAEGEPTPAEQAIADETLEEVIVIKEEEDKEEEVVEEPKDEEMGKKLEDMEARIAEVEKMMTELLPMMKETAEFSNSVLNKLDTFVAETPAELQFNSIKSEYKQFVKDKKDNNLSGLEGIKNIRKNK
jgi:hypothetical protein